MEKVKKQSTNNNSKNNADVIVERNSDLKLRLISSFFLLLFIIVYVGLTIIYTQTTLPNKEIAAWFNYGLTFILIGLAMYELMSLLQIGVVKGQRYLQAVGIFLGLILFVFPIDGRTNQPLYVYMDLAS
jgi:hypothetical protein